MILLHLYIPLIPQPILQAHEYDPVTPSIAPPSPSTKLEEFITMLIIEATIH